MLKKFVAFGAACVVFTGAAVGAEAAAGPSLFKDGTHKVVSGSAVSGSNVDFMFDDADEDLLVAKAGNSGSRKRNPGVRRAAGSAVNKAVPAQLSIEDLKRQRPLGTPAARIVSREGGDKRFAGKLLSRQGRNAVSTVYKSAPDPLFNNTVGNNNKEKSSGVLRDSERAAAKDQTVYGDSSVFDIDDSSNSGKPVSFRDLAGDDVSLLDSTNFNKSRSAVKVLSAEPVPVSKAGESYKEDIAVSSSLFASDSGAIVSDYGAKKISSIPSVREESDYQLLDYTNGIINKIYTKVGYATVVILPPGEKLNRVTLGDRQRFSVQNVFDKSSGSWHIYLKPMQMDIETNLIISTDRHLFNATLATSDFFKPFAKWINVPGAVESVGIDDGALDLAVKDVNQLNFAYSRQGKADFSWAPLNVFDDKNGHTFINFDAAALSKTRPVVFTRGVDGEMKMVPYAVYRNTYVIDNVYDNLEVRSGSKSVRFVRKS